MGYGFGGGYEPREYNRVVPEGDYMITLGMPEDKQVSGYSIREIPIKIEGFSGYAPSKWSVFDCPADDMTKAEKWKEQRTRDFDAFGVARGDFRPEAWQGKRGRVHIAKDNKGYMKVLWSLTEGAPEPSSEQPSQNTPAAQQTQGVAQPFNDDIIPF
jgi:hypothetical protein